MIKELVKLLNGCGYLSDEEEFFHAEKKDETYYFVFEGEDPERPYSVGGFKNNDYLMLSFDFEELDEAIKKVKEFLNK